VALIWDEDTQGEPPAFFTGRVDFTTKPWRGRPGRRSHRYLLDGEQVTGVTSILEDGMPTPKGLAIWKQNEQARLAVQERKFWQRMPEEEAVKHVASRTDEQLDQAANRGTEVHAWAEEFAETGALPTEVPEHLEGRARALEAFLTSWRPEFLLSEKTVFNGLHLYAGTLDAVMVLPGLGNTLVDFKTAKRVYSKNALQAAAYRYAGFWIAEDGTRVALPRIDSTAIVLLNDDGTFSVTPVRAGRAEFSVFLKVKAIAEFEKVGNQVIGRPLPAPTYPETE